MMIKVYSLTGSTTSFTAPAVLIGEANMALVAQAIRVYQANDRQGTSKTKSRHEVSRTTKKVYKQKGTGGARHGSVRLRRSRLGERRRLRPSDGRGALICLTPKTDPAFPS